jgi:hypothetical protein
MGRVSVIDGGRYGLYNASVTYGTHGAATAIAAIDEEIAAIDEKLVEVQEELNEINGDIVEKRIEVDEAGIAYNEAVEAAREKYPRGEDGELDFDGDMTDGSISMGSMYTGFNPFGIPADLNFRSMEITMGDGDSDNSFGDEGQGALSNLQDEAKMTESVSADIAVAYNELMKVAAELRALLNRQISIEKFRDMNQYRRESLEKRREQINAAAAPGDPQSMWCTDLTQDLAGAVESIEIKGAADQILIGPQGVSNIKDDAGSPGVLTRPLAMSPAQCALAWALLPGWQKYRPTYRVGIIHDIDYENDVADVTLDAATSAAQGLNINQEPTELAAIPVRYMSCNAEAFEDDERVVVEFPGQLWGQGPRVIGFETNPQPCRGYVGLVGSTQNFDTLGDENIYEWHQGFPSNHYIDMARSQIPANPMEMNNLYRVGTKIKVGCSWRYPFPPTLNTLYDMKLALFMQVCAADGSVLLNMPLQIPYGADNPYAYTPMDKTFGPSLENRFEAYFSMTEFSFTGPSINLDAACPSYYGLEIGQMETRREWRGLSFFFNGLGHYNAPLLNETIWQWVNAGYASAAGIPGLHYTTREGYAPSCSTPGAGIVGVTPHDGGFYDWFPLGDPCGDAAAAPENLYTDQSWSMEGTIEDDGIHLSDTLNWPRFGRDQRYLQFGAFPSLNATQGDRVLTYNFVHPDLIQQGPHHLTFAVLTNYYDTNKMAVIRKRTRSTFSPWSSYQADSNNGHARFYALAEQDRTRKAG